jgi:hypothetical protein
VPAPNQISRGQEGDPIQNLGSGVIKTTKETYLIALSGKEIVMIGLRTSVSGAVISLLWLAACGYSSPSGTTSTTITLSSTGVSPKASSVSGGSSVNILNHDSVPHQLASSPNAQQTDCPELNSPMLAPGDAFMAAIANRDGTCGFNDILNPTDSSFQGTITVTISPTPTPRGY